MDKLEALVRRSSAHFKVAMTWVLTSRLRMTVREKEPPDGPKFVVPMPDVKSSNFRPLCIVTQEPSPFSNTSSMKRNKPFVTWRCAKSMSGAVVIERPIDLEHEAETGEYHYVVAVRQRVFNNSTHRAWGTSARELRVAVRNNFHPNDIILRRKLVSRRENSGIDDHAIRVSFGGSFYINGHEEGYKREAPTSAGSPQAGDGRF